LKFFIATSAAGLWGIYGFRDAFNLQQGCFHRMIWGWNQAPMVVMIGKLPD